MKEGIPACAGCSAKTSKLDRVLSGNRSAVSVPGVSA